LEQKSKEADDYIKQLREGKLSKEEAKNYV
jgi:hypothetical protein